MEQAPPEISGFGLADSLSCLACLIIRLIIQTGKDHVQLRNDRLKLQNDARATLLQGLGGAVLLLGAYFTWRQLQIAHQQQITERFTRAIEQLDTKAHHTDVVIGCFYWLSTRLIRPGRGSPALLLGWRGSPRLSAGNEAVVTASVARPGARGESLLSGWVVA
jgi:hypothetical protein